MPFYTPLTHNLWSAQRFTSTVCLNCRCRVTQDKFHLKMPLASVVKCWCFPLSSNLFQPGSRKVVNTLISSHLHSCLMKQQVFWHARQHIFQGRVFAQLQSLLWSLNQVAPAWSGHQHLHCTKPFLQSPACLSNEAAESGSRSFFILGTSYPAVKMSAVGEPAFAQFIACSNSLQSNCHL